MGLQPVIANALKAFGQDVLDHAPDKVIGGQRFPLKALGAMISIPVADGLSVIGLDAMDRDGRRDQILG